MHSLSLFLCLGCRWIINQDYWSLRYLWSKTETVGFTFSSRHDWETNKGHTQTRSKHTYAILRTCWWSGGRSQFDAWDSGLRPRLLRLFVWDYTDIYRGLSVSICIGCAHRIHIPLEAIMRHLLMLYYTIVDPPNFVPCILFFCVYIDFLLRYLDKIKQKKNYFSLQLIEN